MSDELNALLELTEIDVKLDAIERTLASLPEQEAYSRAKDEKCSLEEDLKAAQGHEAEVRTSLKKAEEGLELVESHIQQEETKLYSVKSGSPKELMSIQSEIASLKREREKRDTACLEEMESLSSAESAVKDLVEMAAEKDAEIDDLKKAFDLRTSQLHQDKGVLDEERNRILPRIKAETIALYDKLRREKGGVAAAEVIEGTCQGCNMEITDEELDAMSDHDEVWRCPNCKRIIVQKEESR